MFSQISLLISSKDVMTQVRKSLLLGRLIPKNVTFHPTNTPGELKVEIAVQGDLDENKVRKSLLSNVGVLSVASIKASRDNNSSQSTSNPKSAKFTDTKAECLKLLVSFFGEDSAEEIADMDVKEAISYSRGKVAGLIGESAAKAFDALK